MRLIVRKDIDDLKWNALVASSDTQNPLLYTWAMDATSEKWCAIVEGEYDFILPIPYSIKAGVKRARQQAFSRQVDFIGESELLPKAVDLLKSEFKACDVRISRNQNGISDQQFQLLNLQENFEYSTNAKRIITKTLHLVFEQTLDINPLLELYKCNTHAKLNGSKENLARLEKLMRECLKNDKGFAFNALEEGEIVGSCFIILDKSTATYLIGDANSENKKAGVVFAMMDFAIQSALEKGMKLFDFGGSNVESVAQFYRKFGAKDQSYTRLSWNNTPRWFKLLKKIKG